MKPTGHAGHTTIIMSQIIPDRSGQAHSEVGYMSLFTVGGGSVVDASENLFCFTAVIVSV